MYRISRICKVYPKSISNCFTKAFKKYNVTINEFYFDLRCKIFIGDNFIHAKNYPVFKLCQEISFDECDTQDHYKKQKYGIKLKFGDKNYENNYFLYIFFSSLHDDHIKFSKDKIENFNRDVENITDYCHFDNTDILSDKIVVYWKNLMMCISLNEVFGIFLQKREYSDALIEIMIEKYIERNSELLPGAENNIGKKIKTLFSLALQHKTIEFFKLYFRNYFFEFENLFPKVTRLTVVLENELNYCDDKSLEIIDALNSFNNKNV